ncbi:MAG: tetratricopeptide repeat protein [Pseudomonadota bacterium]|nr:tetratricopeptide repeat protein [Pseudomonadota bacterium]
MTANDEIDIARDLIKRAKFNDAEILLKAITDSQKNPEAQQLLGVVAIQTSRVDEAIDYFLKAAIDLPEDGYLQNNLAKAYEALGSLGQAKQAFKRAAELQTELADPLNHLGLLYLKEGKLGQAETALLAAISRDPNYTEAYYNLGVLFEKLGRLPEARQCYESAVKIKPSYIQAIHNLGTVLDDLGKHKVAEGFYRQGILTSPKTPEFYCSLGLCLRQQGKYLEAIDEFLKATKIAPNFYVNKWNLGFLQLAMSEYKEGWANYRFRHTVDREKFFIPEDRLSSKLFGQTIHVAAEQGLGDQIFFSRFLFELKDRGAIVKFQPDPKIESLFERVDGIKVEEITKPNITIADLPYLLGTERIVPSVTMKPKKNFRNDMQARLIECGSPPYIGITYRAGGVAKTTLSKKAPIEEVASILSGISATIICVQRDPKPDELKKFSSLLGREVFDFSDINENLEKALALMTLLDDYIGVSNTNMHLRATTKSLARVLVTHPGEFRWLVAGETSPWFPNFILYRQEVDATWDRAFSRLRLDLRNEYG